MVVKATESRLATGVRIVRASIAGAFAWWVGMQLLFGPAQALLADERFQSPKMTAIFMMEPAPRIVTDPWLLPLGFFITALFQAVTFAFVRPALPRGIVTRGLAFGAVAWALFTPWFEFYLPWNLMLEPTLLVAFEMLIWLALLLLVGLAISLAYGRASAPEQAELPGPTTS
jgi:hypothetical protein